MTRRVKDALGPTGPGAFTWWEGELVPERPDLVEALQGTSVDPEAFAEALRDPLATYRASARARELKAQRSAVITWLRQAAANVDAALADGRLQRLPASHAAPHVWLAVWRMGLEWNELLRRPNRVAITQCLALAIASLVRERPKRGRPSQQARDMLLQLVVWRLRDAGLSADEAGKRADEVLVACRVPSPEGSVARAARRGRRAISVLGR